MTGHSNSRHRKELDRAQSLAQTLPLHRRIAAPLKSLGPPRRAPLPAQDRVPTRGCSPSAHPRNRTRLLPTRRGGGEPLQGLPMRRRNLDRAQSLAQTSAEQTRCFGASIFGKTFVHEDKIRRPERWSWTV